MGATVSAGVAGGHAHIMGVWLNGFEPPCVLLPIWQLELRDAQGCGSPESGLTASSLVQQKRVLDDEENYYSHVFRGVGGYAAREKSPPD